MRLQLTPRVFSRPSYGLPEQACLNVFAEETPHGLAFLPRPPLAARAQVGTGPIRGVFRQKGVFAGSTFAVSGRELYRGTTLVGTIDGSSMVRWAASDSQLVVVDPGTGKAWWYNGQHLRRIGDADLPPVIDCKVLSSRAFFAQKDSGQLWFSALAEVTDVDGLAFFTAESGPDRNVALEVIGNELAVFGQETTEFWAAAGDANAPLVFSRKYDVGCGAQASVLQLDHHLFWLGDQRRVYASAGDAPTRISTPTIEEQLRLAGDGLEAATAFPIIRDGQGFYGLNIPGRGTFVFNVQGHGWTQWASHARALLRVSCGVMSGGEPYLGDDEDGVIWKFGEAQQLDGATRIPHKVSAFLDNPGRPQRVPAITLKAVMGQGAHTTPEAELRVSRDRGRTWEPWQSRSLGGQGEYDLKATWRRLGMVDTRGLVIEVRHSENIVSAALGLELEARP